MKNYLFGLILALASLTASADAIIRQDAEYVLFRDDAGCPAQILEKIVPEERGRFRQADAMIQGKHYTGCYVHTDGVYFIVYEDGDTGVIPDNFVTPVISTRN